MFTVLAYTQSVNPAALTAINAVADPHLRVSGVDVYVPDFADRLVGAWAGGATLLARVVLRSPSLLQRYQFQLEPFDSASATPAAPNRYIDLWDHPIQLKAGEPLEALVTDTAGAGERVTVVLVLQGGDTPTAEGEMFTTRATGTTTLVVNTWTNGAVTFDDNLPAGRYALLGARGRSTGLQAFRLVFPGAAHRPGYLGSTAIANLDHVDFRNRFGGFGVWGTFTNLTPPTVDWLSNSADTAETVFFDLIKVE